MGFFEAGSVRTEGDPEQEDAFGTLPMIVAGSFSSEGGAQRSAPRLLL